MIQSYNNFLWSEGLHERYDFVFGLVDHPFLILGRGSNNQIGNLRWYLPLGVRPPPLNGTNFQTFFYPTSFLLQLNPTYMKRILHLVSVK